MKHFTCPQDCGIFVSFDKICLCKSEEEFSRRVASFCIKSDKPRRRLTTLAQAKEEQKQSQGKFACSQSKPGGSVPQEGGLQIGMPVVVFQDGGGQFKGYVRWLGETYVQQSRKVKGQSNTKLIAVAGIEMVW